MKEATLEMDNKGLRTAAMSFSGWLNTVVRKKYLNFLRVTANWYLMPYTAQKPVEIGACISCCVWFLLLFPLSP